jgi:hypothetical protein
MILSKKEKCLIDLGSKSDKYSSSLYKWVLKNFEDRHLKVWSLQKSLKDGAFLPFNKNDIKIYEIYHLAP